MGAEEPIGDSEARPVIASLTKYIPYPAIPHAGGQYVLQHDRALLQFADVTHFAPNTPVNRDAAQRAVPEVPHSLLTGVGLGGAGGAKTLFDVESALAGSAIPLPYRRLFASARAPWSTLAAANAIELHWSELMALAPRIRRRVPQVPLVGIAHDVITQRWERAASEASGPSRLAFRAAAARSRTREAASFGALDMLIVFSDKDAALATDIAPQVRTEIVFPGLGGELTAVDRNKTEPVVLFTGALNRTDNSRAVQWFLDEMWPAVKQAIPEARFVVAGAQPPASLIAAADADPSIDVTGFVESLEPYYDAARVFVSPLRTGAGVKFKSLDAMLRGIPMVSTSVGAEGIDEATRYADIADNAADFTQAVIAALRQPNTQRAAQAAAWAGGVYGQGAFRKRIAELYLPLLSTPSSTIN